MLNKQTNKLSALALIMSLTFFNVFMPLAQVRAADHADATGASEDPVADLGDSFIFLNPNDNTRVVIALTTAGFIVPGEMANLGFFPHLVVYRFEIENTGDSVPDRIIDVTFSQQTSRTVPQTAAIYLNGIRSGVRADFGAPTTVANTAPTPNPFTVTTRGSVKFFAGMTDDPFYFDIPGFGRFVSSVLAGMPNPTQLERGRDTFAGYNTHTIALEFPVSELAGPAGNIIGLNTLTLRSRNTVRMNSGVIVGSGDFVQVDRAATPGVNVALIPFPRKNEFNAATPVDDANGLFANSIVGTLTALGTNATNIGILASVAVTNGDYLRLNTSTPNTSLGFGERFTTPGYTGFPNGRRLGDDTIDVLLYFITNQTILMGDNTNSNEVPLTGTFPFFGPPNQPFAPGTIDDRTRN
ncbi:MAG: DUF4331 family protein [Pyrinomonadaceae bacterium]